MPVAQYKMNKQLEIWDNSKIEPIESYQTFGLTGSRKSRWVREKEPSYFPKLPNELWDGYSGEESVLLDDVDSSEMGYFLKSWADPYGKKLGELKNGATRLMYKRFYVTSNFPIEKLFADKPELMAALKRRFIEIDVTLQVSVPDLTNLSNMPEPCLIEKQFLYIVIDI